MTKGFHKKTSKRLSAKRRYNIEKKVREHNKKLKKELRKKTHSSRPNKDPGIPNSLPFKEQVIKEAQEDRRRDEERKQLVRDLQKDKRRQQRDDQLLKKRGLDELTADALARGEEFEAKGHSDGHSSTEGQSDKTSNLKSYYKEFHKVIEASDVVVEVLDARDPIGSRCPQVEEEVMRNGANKRLILLLNKVDLIPRENLKKWLRYLRNELPTVAFKACTQKQKSNLSRSRVNVLVSSEELLSSSKCLGADILMKLLSNYCRNKDLKTSITVGVVGFPNVGKSSVINSLKRCHACAVGPTPGLTRAMQLVSLDKRIKLVDSPGIIFADNSNKTEANVHSSSLMALRNAVKIETLSDPTAAVDALLNRVDRQHLTLFYRLSAFKDVNEFLALLAKRFGKLKKGGVVDVEGAARKVLNDWNVGKIRYFTVPPETQCLPFHINAQIVSQMSREFDINERIFDEEMNEINKNIPQNLSESEALLMNSFGFTSARLETEDDKQEDMEQSGAPTTWGQTSILLKQSKQQVCEDSEMKELSELKGMQLNREKRVMFKKLKKQRKRKQKIANKLSNSLQSDISLDNESYDFGTDF